MRRIDKSIGKSVRKSTNPLYILNTMSIYSKVIEVSLDRLVLYIRCHTFFITTPWVPLMLFL